MRNYGDIQNLHSIQVSYYGPTNYRGARLRLYTERFKTKKWLDRDYSTNGMIEQAHEWLEKHGFNVLFVTETKEGYALLTDTFKSLHD